MGKKLGVLIVVILLIGFSIFAVKWINHRLNYVVSDAVFVEIDGMANLSFKRVSGKIEKIYVEEGDKVKKGQLLAKLDDRDFKLKLEKISKEIKALEEKLSSLYIKKKRVEEEIKTNIEIATLNKNQILKEKNYIKAQIDAIEAQIKQLEKDKKRFEPLVAKQLAPEKRLDDIKTNLDVLKAKKEALLVKLNQLNVNLKIAEEKIKLSNLQKAKIKELSKQIAYLKEKISSLKKDKEDVQNLIEYTYLKAPFDGKVAKKFKQPYEIVSSGMPVLALVPEKGFYINVLLEETKLKGIKEGSKAFIKLDAYPDEEFEGVVEKISPAAAAKFALIPRDITAGEFTKVAQRIPVRIKITKGNISLLRVGMGAEVEIKKDE